MRYWYDTEFIEDGDTIDLISIGIVAEDGRELYMQSAEFYPPKAGQWVKENVIPHLSLCSRFPPTLQLMIHAKGQCTFDDPAKGVIGAYTDCPWRTREQMKREILSFMDPLLYGKPELWGYYSAYDHVAFCQLFGTMMDLPKAYPMYTRDIKQWCDEVGNPKLPEQGKGEHNALADARWNKVAWEYVRDYASYANI
jgi:hypothetical protein